MANIPPEKLRIGRALLAGGPITEEFLARELERSGKQGSVLGKALLQSGFPKEEELVVMLLQRLRIPKINARNTKIPLETVALLPEDVAKRCRCLPIDQIGTILVVVTPDLGNEQALAEVRQATGNAVTPIQCSEEGFDGIVADYYRQMASAGIQPAQPAGATATTGAPVGSGSNNGAGVLRAIPAGSASEDSFWLRYMSAGPVPADETLL